MLLFDSRVGGNSGILNERHYLNVPNYVVTFISLPTHDVLASIIASGLPVTGLLPNAPPFIKRQKP
jgi:hypothetical protein